MTILILAAGKGKRMNSNLPKVLHPLLGRSMISHIIRTVLCFSPEEIMVVVSPDNYQFIREELGDEGIRYIRQPEPAGTADAVKRCASLVKTRRTMVLCGDVPLLRSQTLLDMIDLHQSRAASATLLSTDLTNPTGYGRVVRNGDGSVSRIVEHKDATKQERLIREINSGTYIFESRILFDLLEKIKPSQATGEYYLTDVVAMIVASGARVEALKIDDSDEVMGINDKAALKRAEDIFRNRLLAVWREQGGKIHNSNMIFADSDVTVGAGAQITGEAVLRGNTHIGSGSRVGPSVQLEDTVVEGNNLLKGVGLKKSL